MYKIHHFDIMMHFIHRDYMYLILTITNKTINNKIIVVENKMYIEFLNPEEWLCMYFRIYRQQHLSDLIICASYQSFAGNR